MCIPLLPLHAQTAKPGPLKPKEIQEKHYKRPNLVKNGDFEAGFAKPDKKDPKKTLKPHPAHWSPITKEGIGLVELEKPHKHVLQLNVDRQTARTTGLGYKSDPIPATPGKTYDISMDIRARGGVGVIVWAKGYGVMKSGSFAGREREIYNHKKQAVLKKNQWTRFESYFTPRGPGGARVREHRKSMTPTVEFIRVQVYAYGGGAGIAEFDNIRVTERPAPPSAPADSAKTKK